MGFFVVSRNKRESYLAIPIGIGLIFLGYTAYGIDTTLCISFVLGGATSICKGFYPIYSPLAYVRGQRLHINCSPLKRVVVNLPDVISVRIRGPGIYPKNFHVELKEGKLIFNPNFSLIQNDGMVLMKFIEGLGYEVQHVSETSSRN